MCNNGNRNYTLVGSTAEGQKGRDLEAMASLVLDAIDFMPDEEKEAFVLANESGPDVIERESNPIDFLVFDDFDIWKAAKRLMKYWTWRKDVFRDRFTRPMLDLTGNGACNELDIELWKTGWWSRLPDDEHGDALAMIDRTRTASDDLRYMYNSKGRVIICNFDFIRREQRKKGVLRPKVGVMCRIPNFALPRLGFMRNDWTTHLAEALPIEHKWYRMIFLPQGLEKSNFLDKFLPYMLPKLAKRHSPFTKLEYFCHGSTGELVKALVAAGVEEHCIPQSLGGTWSYENLNTWLQRQINGNSSCELREQSNIGKHDSTARPNLDLFAFPLDEEIEKIDISGKISLLRAKSSLPLIFENESCQTLFHSYHRYNSTRAAKHMAKHWLLREKLFSDRSFLQMNQIGTGALDSRNDVKTLETGFLMLLPNDSTGNFVLVYDPSRAYKRTFPSQERVLFYMMHLVMQKATELLALEKATPEGSARCKVITIINKKETELIKDRRRFSDIIEAFPVSITSYHLVLDTELFSHESKKETVTMKISKTFGCSLDQLIAHSNTTGTSVVEKFSAYGLHPESLPSVIGGSWTDEKFALWRKDTVNYEREFRSLAQPQIDDTWTTSYPTNAISAFGGRSQVRMQTNKRQRLDANNYLGGHELPSANYLSNHREGLQLPNFEVYPQVYPPAYPQVFPQVYPAVFDNSDCLANSVPPVNDWENDRFLDSIISARQNVVTFTTDTCALEPNSHHQAGMNANYHTQQPEDPLLISTLIGGALDSTFLTPSSRPVSSDDKSEDLSSSFYDSVADYWRSWMFIEGADKQREQGLEH